MAFCGKSLLDNFFSKACSTALPLNAPTPNDPFMPHKYVAINSAGSDTHKFILLGDKCSMP